LHRERTLLGLRLGQPGTGSGSSWPRALRCCRGGGAPAGKPVQGATARTRPRSRRASVGPAAFGHAGRNRGFGLRDLTVPHGDDVCLARGRSRQRRWEGSEPRARTFGCGTPTSPFGVDEGSTPPSGVSGEWRTDVPRLRACAKSVSSDEPPSAALSSDATRWCSARTTGASPPGLCAGAVGPLRRTARRSRRPSTFG
jgi:hypothetical protein